MHIFIASLHFCLYLVLFVWPLCITVIFLLTRHGVPDSHILKMLQDSGCLLVSDVVLLAQTLAAVSIVSATAHELKLTAS
jgi:uncharacterized membrane protein YkgB